VSACSKPNGSDDYAQLSGSCYFVRRGRLVNRAKLRCGSEDEQPLTSVPEAVCAAKPCRSQRLAHRVAVARCFTAISRPTDPKGPPRINSPVWALKVVLIGLGRGRGGLRVRWVAGLQAG
jgi:hypothetical protein